MRLIFFGLTVGFLALAPRAIAQSARASDDVAQTSLSQQVSTEFSSQAQLKGFYLTGALGGNWPQAANVHKLNTATPYGFQEFHNSGVSIEAGLGYDFGQLRSEITYSYDTSLASSYSDYSGVYDYSPRADVVKNNALVSLYWDIPLSTRLVPYIGGGIGYTALNASPSGQLGPIYTPYSAYLASGFGYQAKLGMSYLINRRSDVFAEAVYRGMASYQASDGIALNEYGNYNSLGFQIGARVRFGT
jgi:opacity protein-like surface antigen